MAPNMTSSVKVFSTIPPYLVISRGLLRYVRDVVFSGVEFLLDIGFEIARKRGLEKLQLASKLYLNLANTVVQEFKRAEYDWCNLKIILIVPDSWDLKENIKLAKKWFTNYRWVRGRIEALGFNVEEYVAIHRCLTYDPLFNYAELKIPEELQAFDGFALGTHENTVTCRNIKCGEDLKNAQECITINKLAIKLLRERFGYSRRIHLLGPPLRTVLIPLINDGVKFDSADTTSYRLDILHFAHMSKKNRGKSSAKEYTSNIILTQWLYTRYFRK